MTPNLSICIPTFNRAMFLDDLLDSIRLQISERHRPLLEICISDNASTDDTPLIVAGWQERLPVPLVYHRNPENMGADRNYLQAVAIASGQFCWLMGSDDRVEPGGIDVVLAVIDANPELDAAILARNYYDGAFQALLPIRQPLSRAFTSDFCFPTGQDAINHVAYELGYLSVLVFRRSLWLEVKGFEEFIGSAYVHVFKLLAIIRDSGGKVMYLSRPAVGWRAHNDSFLDELKYLGRIRIDVLGYRRIADRLFGTASAEYRSIMNQVVLTHLRGYAEDVHLARRGQVLRLQVLALYLRHLWSLPSCWTTLVPLLLLPTWGYHLLKRGKSVLSRGLR